MLIINDFKAALKGVASKEDLASLLIRDMRAEGYDNITFRRVKKQQILQVPCAALPQPFVDEYYANAFMGDDPIMAAAQRYRRRFHWSELNINDMTLRQRNLMEVFRDLGVQSGTSFPFHGPDGCCDLIGISQRHAEPLDLTRIGLIEDKIKLARWRYWELRQNESSAIENTHHCESWAIHKRGPQDMMANHCRALVFVSVAAHRWRHGLTGFNKNLFNYVSQADVEFLLRWGLVQERPDEEQFYYYYAPTVLGQHHMRSCTHVPDFINHVWEMVPASDARIQRSGVA